VGWGKVVCWSTKAAISLKHVKTEEKLPWMAYRNSPTLFRTVRSRPPMAFSSPRLIGGSQPPPKTPIAIISGTGEATDFKFGRNIHKVHSNQSQLKFWRTGSLGVSRDCPIFWVPLLSQERAKLRTSNFVGIFKASIGRKPIKNFGKST